MSAPAHIRESQINELANRDDNIKRISEIDNCFAGSPPLLQPGRVLIGQGTLHKVCRKEMKKRKFFLFNDLLVYGTIIAENKLYRNRHEIDVMDVKVVPVPNNPKGWQLLSPQKSFEVVTADVTERDAWVKHIEKCKKLLPDGGNEDSKVASVWCPDTNAERCMHCDKTKFTFVNRRHHCRNCGKVVCGTCSKKKHMIPHIDKVRLQRICDGCFDTLSSTSSKVSAPIDARPMESSASEESTGKTAGSTVGSKKVPPPRPTLPPGAPVAAPLHESSSDENVEDDDDDDDDDDEGTPPVAPRRILPVQDDANGQEGGEEDGAAPDGTIDYNDTGEIYMNLASEIENLHVSSSDGEPARLTEMEDDYIPTEVTEPKAGDEPSLGAE